MAKDKRAKKQRRREQFKIHKTNKNSKKIVKAKGQRKKDVKRLDKETASVYKFSPVAMPNQSEMSIESERNEENVRKERVIEVISDSDDSIKEATVINLDSDDLESDFDISELDQTDIDKDEDENPTQVKEKCDDEQDGQQRTEKVLSAKFFPVEGDHDIIGVLLIKPLSMVAINGKFILQVLKGKQSIHGYEVSPFTEPVSVFSSKSTGLLQINDTSEHIPDNFDITFQLKELKELFVDEWESVLREIESHSSVALLKKLPICEMDFALNFKPYQNLTPVSGKVDLINAEDPHILKVQHCQITAKDIITTFQHRKDDDNFRVLLCGSKNTGKSTFARFLANSVLNSSSRVFFLECDVGQTEFTPPGLVSLSEVCSPLLGPPFTHQTRPIRSHFFGNTSPRDDPTFYITCIHEAFQFYMEYHRQDGPLIINTQGWMKGLGLSLLIDVIRITIPNRVLQFKTKKEVEKAFCPLSQEFVDTQPGWAYDPAMRNATTPASSTSTEYFVLQAPNENSSRTRSMKAADYRRLSLYTYFGHLFFRKICDSESMQRSYMIKRPINSLLPRIVYWKDVAVHVMHHNVPPSSIIASVTFSLVSLAKVEQNQILDLPEKILPDGPRFLCKSPVAVHIGFGFIRNVDISKKAFIIITPLPVDLLGEVNTFLKGNLDLPVELFNQDSSISTPYCIPEVQSSIRGSRARKPRYNLKRRKFDTSPSATGHS